MPESNVRRINGVEITGTPGVGDVPVATSATAATWGSAVAPPDLTGAVILAPTTAGRNTIVEGSASVPHLILKASGLYSPVTNMQEWQDSSGTVIARVNYPGVDPVMEVRADLVGANILGFKSTASGVDPAILGTNDGTGAGVKGTNTYSGPGVYGTSDEGNAGLFHSGDAANTAPTLAVRQYLAGAANLQEWQNAAASALSYVDSLGVFHGPLAQKAVVCATSGTCTSYATLALAKAAAASGDTIVVYPGTYNEKDLLKNGVNWFFYPGANVTYSGSANGGIFDDTATGANGAVTCVIAGYGTFTSTGSGTTNNIVLLGNASSNITIYADTMQTTGHRTINVPGTAPAYLWIKARKIQATNSGAIYTLNATLYGMYIEADYITGTGGAVSNWAGGTIRANVMTCTSSSVGVCFASISLANDTVVDVGFMANTHSNNYLGVMDVATQYSVTIRVGQMYSAYSGTGTSANTGLCFSTPSGYGLATGKIFLTVDRMYGAVNSSAHTYPLMSLKGSNKVYFKGRVDCTGTNGIPIAINNANYNQSLILLDGTTLKAGSGATYSIVNSTAGAEDVILLGTVYANKGHDSSDVNLRVGTMVVDSTYIT